jgi:hypothetical protein
MCSSSSVVFSLGLLVSSTNKTDRHDITEILLKNALTTIKPNQTKPNQSPHGIAWQIQSAFKFFEYDSIFTYIAT